MRMRERLRVKLRCEKCEVRISNNRPMLKCSMCNSIKHFKCNSLSKNEAYEIFQNIPEWACQDYIFSILPVNLVLNIKPKLENCAACLKQISSKNVVSKCSWCDGRCHKSCLNGSLGCSLVCKFCYHLGITGDMRYEKNKSGEVENVSFDKEGNYTRNIRFQSLEPRFLAASPPNTRR